jgi:hypothetical protein
MALHGGQIGRGNRFETGILNRDAKIHNGYARCITVAGQIRRCCGNTRPLRNNPATDIELPAHHAIGIKFRFLGSNNGSPFVTSDWESAQRLKHGS